MVKIVTNDQQEFTVERDILRKCLVISNMIEDIGETVANVSGPIMEKVIQYLTYHKDEALPDESDPNYSNLDNISDWDKAFCQVDQGTLFELILAANYLDIKPLLDLTCKTVAKMIKGKNPEEIRRLFNIQNDFTPEEEEAIRKENEWCEEK